jgi:hypothetical protein
MLFKTAKIDALVKSRHSGENRSPEVVKQAGKDWIPAPAPDPIRGSPE